MDNTKINELFDELKLHDSITLEEIPNIDLYMDQVITLFDQSFKNSKRTIEDKLLTKTMINNYTKDKLLIPALNKKYSKEHIILMIMIYSLKQTLSINDIKTIFSKIVSDKKESSASLNLSLLYKNYLSIKKLELEEFKNSIEARSNQISNIIDDDLKKDDQGTLILTILSLIENANTNKRLAEKLIDTYFAQNVKK